MRWASFSAPVWYDAHVLGVWDFDKAPWRARPEALLELRIEYEDGHTATITSDNHWQATTGPIIFDSIYAGENYDARLEKPGWDTAAYKATNWAAANVVPAPGASSWRRRCRRLKSRKS